MSICLALPLVDLYSKSLRTHPNDTNVDPNSSEGVDLSSSEGVDMMYSEGVDTMLTQTPATLPSVHVPNVSCRRIIRLQQSHLPIQLNTAAFAATAAIAAIAVL